MTRDPKSPDLLRRRLLSGGAVGVAASAAALVSSDEAAADPEQAPEDPTRPSYRVTEHIAAYYRRARE